MDKGNMRRPVEEQTLRVMLNRIDGALSALEHSGILNEHMNYLHQKESFITVLKRLMYQEAYRACLDGEAIFYNDIFDWAEAETFDKEKLIEKYKLDAEKREAKYKR